MTSVTQILDRFPEKELVEWQLRDVKKAKQISQEALRVGTAVDRMIQAQWRQETILVPENDPAILNAWGAWKAYCTDHPDFFPSITAIQEELTDGVTVGHPDLTCRKYEGWGTVSIKCSAAIRPSYWTQEAAYALLRGRQYPTLGFPTFLAILRLDKVTGRPEYQELTDPEQIRYEMEIFRKYVALYYHRETVAERTRLALEQEVLG